MTFRLACLSLGAMIVAASVAHPLAQGPGQVKVGEGQRLAGQVFKNVQVLKDVTVDDFMTVMGLMTAAVGGDCADCHKDAGTNRVDWPFDTARKIAARRMSAMVMAINRD